MTPRDYAVEIDPGASAVRLHEIERVIRKALEGELCRVAQMIDADYFDRRIASPLQAARICRDEAENHQRQT
jgi:hypothetical protein